jgi:hypothetical protein
MAKIWIDEVVFALYRNGMTYEQLAAQYDMNLQTVRRRLLRIPGFMARHAGASPQQRPTGSQLKTYAINLFLGGFTQDEVRDITDLDVDTLDNWLMAARKKDPSFPSERGRNGRVYNWIDRTTRAITQAPDLQTAAELLHMSYGGLVHRKAKLQKLGVEF